VYHTWESCDLHTKCKLRTERKVPLGRLGDNIKMDLKRLWCECVDWIHVDRDQWRAFVNRVMNLGVHKRRGNS
jgi:hypothetical protein